MSSFQYNTLFSCIALEAICSPSKIVAITIPGGGGNWIYVEFHPEIAEIHIHINPHKSTWSVKPGKKFPMGKFPIGKVNIKNNAFLSKLGPGQIGH